MTTKKTCRSRRFDHRFRNPCSPQLLARIRDWVEREIDFVDHPLFKKRDAEAQLQAMRPTSLDELHISSKPEPGLAFVSGMVESPLLTVEEEQYLFKQMNYLKCRAERNRRRLSLNRPEINRLDHVETDLQAATGIRNRIVQSNLRLAVSLARKLSGSLDQLSELVSEGTLPLIRAVELFDVSRGHRFSTYATWAVRNQLLRSLKRRREAALNIGPNEDSWLDAIADTRTSPDWCESQERVRSDIVRQMMTVLSDRERQIVGARFGLDGQPQDQSLQDIALQHGLSKERVRQVVLRAIEKLQAVARSSELPE